MENNFLALDNQQNLIILVWKLFNKFQLNKSYKFFLSKSFKSLKK